MIESMTGFVRRSIEISFNEALGEKKMSLVVEFKSLNSRYFETAFRLPPSFSHLELKLVPILKKKLIRGRVFCGIKSEASEVALETYQPVTSVIKQYVDIAKSLSVSYGLSDDLSVSKVLVAPGAFVPVSIEMSEDQEQAFLTQFEDLLSDLQRVRRAEGAILAKDLLERIAVCRDRVARIKDLFEVFFEAKKEELARFKELCVDPQKILDDPSLKLKLDELHSVVHRGDIHEELVRFNAHLVAFDRIVSSSAEEETGRRFDFTLQELHREVNTMMAKTSLTEISSAGIDIKCELEKMREQIQNIV